MKADVFYYQGVFVDADIQSISKSVVVFNTRCYTKDDLNQLVKMGAGITFLKDKIHIHVCLPAKNVEEIEFT